MAEHRLRRREFHVGWLLALLVVAVVVLAVAVWMLVTSLSEVAAALPAG
jgi:hypothetical protein